MALRGTKISLSYFHEVPHSVQFNPQRNEASSYQSSVEVTKFLRVPQQDFTKQYMEFPLQTKLISLNRNSSNTSTSQHKELHSISPAVVRDLFSPIQQQRSRLAHIRIHRIHVS